MAVSLALRFLVALRPKRLATLALALGLPMAQAAPTLTPATLNFGTVTVGNRSAVQLLTITNVDAGPLTMVRPDVPNGFLFSSNCPSQLPRGSSCQYSVVFNPTAVSTYSGRFSVNTAAGIASATLVGGGIASATTPTSPTTPVAPSTSGGQLSDVLPRRAVASVGSDLTQTVSYAFSGAPVHVSVGDGLFCLALALPLPPNGVTTGNPCQSGTEFARHPQATAGFQATRVHGAVQDVRETIRVPSAVSRFAREHQRSRYYFVRQFNGNQWAVLPIELLGAVADAPLSVNDVRLGFRRQGLQALAFVPRGGRLPAVEAQLRYSGSGWLRGTWEVVEPGDPEPTEVDLTAEASLPANLRGLQQRYRVVGQFQQYLPALGLATIQPPDPALLPVAVDGGYRLLLRLRAETALGDVLDHGWSGGSAGFLMPVLRYWVGSLSDVAERIDLPAIALGRPLAQHRFGDSEAVRFQWQHVAAARLYLLEAADAEGRVLAAAEVPAVDRQVAPLVFAPAYEAPPPWRARAAQGAARWRITAFGPDGQPLARSDWRAVAF